MFDENEFNLIFDKHKNRIFNYCFARLKKNKYDADEVMNDTFDVLFKKWDQLEKGEDIGAYLYRVADMFIRKKNRENNKYYSHNEAFDPELAEKTGQVGIHNDVYFEDRDPDIDKYIDEIKRSLNEEDRRLFSYRYIEKKTFMEIADLTGMPYSSIRYRMIRIDKIVKEKIKNIFK